MNTFKKIWHWIDDRSGLSELIVPQAKHTVPPDAKWHYVFGSATLFSFAIQVFTGIGLAFMYQPSSETAYPSLRYISYEAPLGSILRGIHYFGASAMILLIGLHMIRVYLYGSFKYPREMSWITGVFLLFFTVTIAFTGQLLRWDNSGVWGAVVAAEQIGRVPLIGKWIALAFLGGENIDGFTLGHFFALHVFLIPAILFLFIGFHIYLVLRNGISEPPKLGRPVVPETYRKWYNDMLKEKGVPFWPDAAWRDISFSIVVLTAVLFLGIVFEAPELTGPPDPTDIIVEPRPDWYLLWVFAVLALMTRGVETFVLAFGPFIIGALLFAVPFLFNKGERSLLRRPSAVVSIIFIVTVVGIFWHEGKKATWSPDFKVHPLSDKVVGNVGADAKAGADLMYKKACLYCHTLSGYGGARGSDLTHIATRLNADEITIRIVNGGGNMPALGSTVSQKELEELIAFLKTRE